MSVNQNFPEVSPSLLLDFANSRTLDPRITFERSSIGTYVASNGLIKTAAADEARFDHNPETGESLGLLIEESRTNLFTNSENLTSGAGWSNVSQSSMTATNVSEENPGGGSTTTQITGGGVNSWWAKTFTASVSTTYQISLWVKVADGGADFNVGIRFYAPGATSGAIIYGTGFNVTSSWKRVTGYVTSSANFSGSLSRYIVLQLDNTRSFYAWGIQVEAGSFPTSYIPTSGSQVTRQPDNASITGTNFSSWYSPFNGTYIIDIKNNSTNTSGLPSPFRTNSIFTFLDASGYYTKNNTSNVQISQGPTTTNLTKWAIYHDGSNGYGMTINGRTPVSNTQAIGTSDTNIQFNDIQGATSFYLNRLAYYPERLTDSQLQNLTK